MIYHNFPRVETIVHHRAQLATIGHHPPNRWLSLLSLETDGCRWFEHSSSTARRCRRLDHQGLHGEKSLVWIVA